MTDMPLAPDGVEGRPFYLMNGLGNDFVIVDLRRGGRLDPAAARLLADREGPWGADQIIGMHVDGTHIAAMSIWNADGSTAGACGNAARCVGHILMQEAAQDEIRFGSPSGVLTARAAGENRVSVDMGPPLLRWDQIPLAEEIQDTRFVDIKLGPIDAPVLWGPSAVSMGNPHCVFFVEDIEAHALDRFGPMIEHHPTFPEGANVSLAQVTARDAILLKVWERGTGLTKACGTAACAALVAAHRRRLTGREATVTLPGGALRIVWRETDDQVEMTGPVEETGRGMFGA